MIRKTLILLWMLFPVAVAAYHFNFGPRHVARRHAYQRLCGIQDLERQADPDYGKIIEEYGLLADELPEDDNLTHYQIRLAVARCRLEMLDLKKASDDLTRLLRETAASCGENAPITRGIREQLGKAHYYAVWALKTSGASEDEWRPYAERARQLFRFLAESENPKEYKRYEDRVRGEFQKAVDRLSADGREGEGDAT